MNIGKHGRTVGGSTKKLLKIAELLCNLHFVRSSSAISKSKQSHSKKQSRKKDVGRQYPLPDVNGEVLFGIHPVQAALYAGKRQAYTAFFKTGVHNDRLDRLREQCVQQNLDILDVTGPVIDSLSGNHPHQGVCLDVSPYEHSSISIDSDIVSERLFNSNGEPQVWVLPYRVKDTMNMGAVLRSSLYFGVNKVLVPAHYSSALNPVVSKASAGALEVMDIQSLKYESTLKKCLLRWKDEGGTVVGSTSDESHEKALHLQKYTADRPTLLIIGSEAVGIDEKITGYCDVLLCVQNYQTYQESDSFCVDSLNVSVATGVLLHNIMMNRSRNC
ncbi:rRNA methyltransferase 1, mitochondrial-like isoform X2 [Mercenaria mercenaria]|uniref:rRNA methyltransferase 1, mitochondrial-like isoform X2 n=1 Tax=Mercenaria mercenaria TaxID=6596 RepID=UPI00234F4D40|nr:rRNA methyltransferase 1, mitochondrial-like isoform X2 [Mercenaria mercenaria]